MQVRIGVEEWLEDTTSTACGWTCDWAGRSPALGREVYRTLQLTSTSRMRLRRNGGSVLAAELRR
jgi:hypothetical protein